MGTTLYVLIDQEKIKAEVIKKARSIKLKATSSRSAYVYSIPQIIPVVKRKDVEYNPKSVNEHLIDKETGLPKV